MCELLEGNVHLSHDLIRLGFVKLFIFLTRPISATYTDDLLEKYKHEVMEHRDKDGWLIDQETSAILAGKGIGEVNKLARDDYITINHLNLARSLDFVRSNNSWARFGYLFASLFADESGTAIFFDTKKLDEILKSEGLVGSFRVEEKPIFASALLSADIDGSISLLKCLSNQEGSISEIRDSYFPALASWYEEKAQFEFAPEKRYRYLQRAKELTKIKEIKNRIESKGKEYLLEKKRTHAYEQAYPRLQFLKDLGFVSGRDKFKLTEKGDHLSKLAVLSRIPSRGRRSLEAVPGLLRSELLLRNEVVKLYSEGMRSVDADGFDKIFEQTCRFYSKIGMVLFSYENIFLATSAMAIKSKASLDLSLFESYTTEMALEKRIVISDTGRGEKYIKPLG